MFKRPTRGSIVCPDCGRLVGVRDERCLGCGRRNPGLWGFAPGIRALGKDLDFGKIVLGGCSALYLASLLYSPDKIGFGGLTTMLSPDPQALLHFGMSGMVPTIVYGRWWTVLSAAWLHGGLLHILLNMLWVTSLIRSLGEMFGISRLIIIYTLSAIAGFGISSAAGLLAFVGFPAPLTGAFFTVGASAPLFGLFGAIFLYGQRTGNRALAQHYLRFVMIWVVIGVFAGFGSLNAIRMDNWAHLGGFLGGYLAALMLDPLREERPIHGLLAMVCLLANVGSIVASVLVAVPVLAR